MSHSSKTAPVANDDTAGEVPTDEVMALARQDAVFVDPASPQRFVNRELSWLAFNRRVIEEAQNKRHPLFERVRFLSISASNLDEFYMVRVAGLMGMVRNSVATPSADGLTPAQQLAEVNAEARALIADQQAVWTDLHGALRNQGIAVVTGEEITAGDRTFLDDYFAQQVSPV